MPSPDHAATVRAFLDNCVPGLTTPDVADAQAALDALVADLERVTRERDEARLETSLQMQDKLDAQSLLANICQAIAIDRSDFDLDDTWKTVAQTILARLTEIVDTANRDSERAERAERERDEARKHANKLGRELDEQGDELERAERQRDRAIEALRTIHTSPILRSVLSVMLRRRGRGSPARRRRARCNR